MERLAPLARRPRLAAPAFHLEGHRGARGLAPENTLPAFARALSIGVTTLELDVGVTRDGVVVISHERGLVPNTARGPDGKWLSAPGPMIHDLTYAELERYDVGRLNPQTRYARQFPDQVPVDGTRIPRLADLFALVKKAGNDAVRFNIETKLSPEAPGETLAPEPFARALIAAIRAGGMEKRSMIQSFDWRTLKLVQAEAPQIPTVYLSAQQRWLDNIRAGDPAGSPWTAGLKFADYGSVPKMVKAAGGAIWSPYFGDLDAAKVAEAHALGLEVIPWTAGTRAQIDAMLALGVDGLITDRPDWARDAMQHAGIALPAGKYYVTDLIGCDVWQAEARLGAVRDVQFTGEEAPGTPLLVVETLQGELLIPLAEEICRRLDVAARRIEVVLPEGLRELNAGE